MKKSSIYYMVYFMIYVCSYSQNPIKDKLNEINDFVPNGHNILDSLSGYINNDNFSDKIIVLANNQEYKNNESRMLLVLLSDQNGGYILKSKTPNFIPCLKCAGGTGGEDSYSNLASKNKSLSFNQLKIIDQKVVDIKYDFFSKNDDFFLNKVTVNKSNLSENSESKVTVTITKKIPLKDFNYNNYSIYLKINATIKDSDGYTNLRKGKNSSSEILQKINTGSEIEVLDNSEDWWLVKTKEGKKGYVYKSKIVSE